MERFFFFYRSFKKVGSSLIYCLVLAWPPTRAADTEPDPQPTTTLRFNQGLKDRRELGCGGEMGVRGRAKWGGGRGSMKSKGWKR